MMHDRLIPIRKNCVLIDARMDPSPASFQPVPFVASGWAAQQGE